MDTGGLRARLRQILVLALTAPVPIACATGMSAPLFEEDASDGGGATTDSGTEASRVTAEPDVGVVDASSDASAKDASASGFDANAYDASNGGAGPCTVIEPGYPGGANCIPMVSYCDPASSASACSWLCAICGVQDAGSERPIEANDVRVRCFCNCGGRRPAGFDATTGDAHRSLGAFFANLSELEAASVDAFEILRDELVAHGAPRHLVDAAKSAAEDEIRHARITGALAKRYGGNPMTHASARGPLRDLEAIAIENAREGCVRETYGALVAMLQAERASDPVIRRAMRRIAEDETRHASLAWSVASWAGSKLDDEARARVTAAMREACDDLANEARLDPSPTLCETAGIPTSVQASRMIAALLALA